MYSAKEIILSQIKPALGCTEPAAIALNAAYLKEEVKQYAPVRLIVNTNLLKNAMYVPIPNTGRRFGVKLAFALGFVCGNKKDGLNIFKNVTDECLKKAEEIIKLIDVEVVQGNEIYIKSSCNECEVLSEKYHDNISYVKNGDKIYKFEKTDKKNSTEDIEKWLKKLSFKELFELFDKEDYGFLKQAVDMNLKLAQYGLENECALNIGKSLIKNKTLENRIKAVCTAASDARMEGVNLAAMSVFGSGNHGIAAMLPVWTYAKEKNFEDTRALKAVGLSILITVYIKLFIGRLSPICGAAFASGCGVAGGIAALEGDYDTVKNAVSFMIQTINGVICDGAKMGCSLKVMLAAENGFKAAMFALEHKQVLSDGILEDDITGSIKNLEKIKNSMRYVDGEIVDIMKNKIV